MDMRVERMAASAQKIAEFLATRPEIELVSFPGLPSHPGHELAKKQMSGFGTTIGITFKGSKKDAKECECHQWRSRKGQRHTDGTSQSGSDKS